LQEFFGKALQNQKISTELLNTVTKKRPFSFQFSLLHKFRAALIFALICLSTDGDTNSFDCFENFQLEKKKIEQIFYKEIEGEIDLRKGTVEMVENRHFFPILSTDSFLLFLASLILTDKA